MGSSSNQPPSKEYLKQLDKIFHTYRSILLIEKLEQCSNTIYTILLWHSTDDFHSLSNYMNEHVIKIESAPSIILGILKTVNHQSIELTKEQFTGLAICLHTALSRLLLSENKNVDENQFKSFLDKELSKIFKNDRSPISKNGIIFLEIYFKTVNISTYSGFTNKLFVDGIIHKYVKYMSTSEKVDFLLSSFSKRI